MSSFARSTRRSCRLKGERLQQLTQATAATSPRVMQRLSKGGVGGRPSTNAHHKAWNLCQECTMTKDDRSLSTPHITNVNDNTDNDEDSEDDDSSESSDDENNNKNEATTNKEENEGHRIIHLPSFEAIHGILDKTNKK